MKVSLGLVSVIVVLAVISVASAQSEQSEPENRRTTTPPTLVGEYKSVISARREKRTRSSIENAYRWFYIRSFITTAPNMG